MEGGIRCSVHSTALKARDQRFTGRWIAVTWPLVSPTPALCRDIRCFEDPGSGVEAWFGANLSSHYYQGRASMSMSMPMQSCFL